jgi:hypothetical protein
MSVRFRVFASGQLMRLSAEDQVLYKVPTGKSVVVNSMRFTRGYFPPGQPAEVTYWVRIRRQTPQGATTSTIFPNGGLSVLSWNYMAVEDSDLPLFDGEEILANVGAPDSAVIHFIICGMERDS